MIGRKQGSTDADWRDAWQQAQASPDRAAARALVEQAAEQVRARAATADGAILYGWSGGKDSIALDVVMRAAGVGAVPLLVTASPDLEYPAFLRWVEQHKPPGLIVHQRSRIDMGWLQRRPEMLFPAARQAARWFANVQHAGQRAAYRDTGAALLCLGRRRQDGNYLGQRGPHGYEYTNAEHITRYSPIGEWTHESLLNVLAAYGCPMPPIYDWPRGFEVGTGAWPARQGAPQPLAAWRETWQVDPALVEQGAAADLPYARDALRRLRSIR